MIQLAVERDKKAKTTKATTTATTTTTNKPSPPQNIQDQLPPIVDATSKKSALNIEDILKQYNLTGVDVATPSPTNAPTLPYGSSNDAILAALLKQQGISPPTPKSLADQIKQAVRAL